MLIKEFAKRYSRDNHIELFPEDYNFMGTLLEELLESKEDLFDEEHNFKPFEEVVDKEYYDICFQHRWNRPYLREIVERYLEYLIC